jgi:glycosyltransferase involved in cell wall biosynthesis
MLDLDSLWESRQDFEFLLVDNGSSDDSVNVVKEVLAGARFPWRIVEETTPGVNSARNAGLKEAKGDFIVFTDSDLQFQPGWLRAYLDAAERCPEVEVFAGRVRVGNIDCKVPDWLDLTGEWKRSCIVVQADFGENADVRQLTSEYGPVGPNMAFRKSLFDRIGPFDVRFGLRPGSLVAGAEAEFFDRLSRLGVHCAWVPEAVVDHPMRRNQMTKPYFLKRLHGVGRVAARIAWMRGDPAKRLCGLTLYRLPETLRAMLTWWGVALRGDIKRAFFLRGQLSILMGYLHEDLSLWRARRCAARGQGADVAQQQSA